MQPRVIGAADAGVEELKTLKHDWPHDISSQDLIDAVFDHLFTIASSERDRTVRLNLPETVAKRNRRDTYLKPERLAEWRARSEQFLERQKSIASKMSVEMLYSSVAMQHYLDLDCVDAHLPADLRRSEDTYEDGLSQQFLIDAPRGFYVVEGEIFNYADIESGETEAEFTQRLVSAVRRVTPAALVVNVTNAMSQSGLAALERASLCTTAVSGGTQEVNYSLEKDPADPDVVFVSLQVYRHGFREYILASSDDPSPLSCDAGSIVKKSATVAFGLDREVDVVDLVEDIQIWQEGQLLPMEDLCVAIPIPLPMARPDPRSAAKTGWQMRFSKVCACVRKACPCSRRHVRGRNFKKMEIGQTP